MMYALPKSLEVCGVEYEIRSDYRVVLDICTALADPDLDDFNRMMEALEIFYPAFDDMPPSHYEKALKKCYWFINGGDEEDDSRKAPKLMDWEQDFKYIVAPINRVMGTEVRALEYLHHWTFLSAYREIGDCTFAQIVRIRSKKAKGKQLDKDEQRWYRENRKIVDIKQTYSTAEKETLSKWGV